jgi:hemolysin activation/secretion protein
MRSQAIESVFFFLLSLGSIFLPIQSLNAQSLGNPIIPPPQPPTLPTPLPPPGDLIKPIPPQPIPEIPRDIPEKIQVNRFIFEGNTAFSNEELAAVTKPFTDRLISFTELLQARSAVTQLYIDRGYITSGAFIPLQSIEQGVVKIKIIEGSLEDIRLTVNGRLNPNYIRDRIKIATNKPLNINRLLEALQVLQLDPIIQRVSAELAAGTRPGTNILDVTVDVADTSTTELILDNGRSPSVGSFRRGIQLQENSLLGLGDRLQAWYLNTDGSNDLALIYNLPINAYDGTIGLEYRFVGSRVIEPPLDVLDINSEYQDVVLSYRQPVTRNPNQELVFGATLEYQRNQSKFLDDQPLIGYGTDNQGLTSTSALRLFQEWTVRGRQDVVFLRSELSFGLGIFGATEPFDKEVNPHAPNTNYFLWRGQAQWVRLFAPDTLLVLRGNLQLADSPLVPLEQFALGGLYSVRGYQQNFILTDNGLFASAEFRWPILRLPQQQQLLQIVPFIDTGTGWNSFDVPNPDPQTLLSIGLGFNWQWGETISARIDWGYPLMQVNSLNDTWQNSGFTFSIIFKAF